RGPVLRGHRSRIEPGLWRPVPHGGRREDRRGDRGPRAVRRIRSLRTALHLGFRLVCVRLNPPAPLITTTPPPASLDLVGAFLPAYPPHGATGGDRADDDLARPIPRTTVRCGEAPIAGTTPESRPISTSSGPRSRGGIRADAGGQCAHRRLPGHG